MNNQTVDLPIDVEEVFRQRPDIGILLSIEIHGIMLNCHFFTEQEIELDLDPREVSDEARWRQLSSFILNMAEALGKEVYLTEENWPEAVHFVFHPMNRGFDFIPAASAPPSFPDESSTVDLLSGHVPHLGR